MSMESVIQVLQVNRSAYLLVKSTHSKNMEFFPQHLSLLCIHGQFMNFFITHPVIKFNITKAP